MTPLAFAVMAAVPGGCVALAVWANWYCREEWYMGERGTGRMRRLRSMLGLDGAAALLRDSWNNENRFLMSALTFVTLVMGLILANPDEDTFAGRGWTVFASLHLARVHPSEEQWGTIFVLFAFFGQLGSVWFLASVQQDIREGRAVNHRQRPSYRWARFIWGLTCSLYAVLALSAWASNPWGIFALFMVLPSALAFRVLVRVRHQADSAGE